MLKHYFEIRKVDEDQRMVYGYASTESVDAQGETVTKAAMEAAWEDYMKFANVREMHGNSAAGIVKEYQFDDKGVFIGAEIVDDQAWNKVKKGVYKGFSIGGKKLPGGYDAISKTITALKLTEISLVDRPANPEALITMYKADSLENTMTTEQEKAPESAAEKLQALLAKGDVSAEALLELLEKSSPEDKDAVKTDDTAVQTEPVAKDPSALRKSFQALLATGDDVKKGLYSVADLANLVNSLRWIQDSCAYEAQNEGDGSAVPAKLAQCCADLCAALVEMAQEECAELCAQLQGGDGMPALTMVDTLIANSASAQDVKKYNDALDILKAGARNSASDLERIQKAHDLLNELGAACGQADETSKVEKSDSVEKHDHEHGDIQKVLQTFEKLSGEVGTLRKSLETVSKENEELKKRFDTLPAAPKGALMTIEKAEDVTSVDGKGSEVAPVLKQDGSIDEVATQIKKVYAGGGRQIGSIR